ncbi:HD domain-containing protein [Candidatus Aerophobetes bacterium]|nr:HD domain-containing protein [Candidatus Aerophobetes bacterium]
MMIKEYRDPLYGFITLDELEQRIVDTSFFQRLRYIMQLGTTYLVYPSATHTRFEHSLGVLQASSFLFDHLAGNPENLEILKWKMTDTKKHRKLLRLASLLHDIGHGPFSHTLPKIYFRMI